MPATKRTKTKTTFYGSFNFELTDVELAHLCWAFQEVVPTIKYVNRTPVEISGEAFTKIKQWFYVKDAKMFTGHIEWLFGSNLRRFDLAFQRLPLHQKVVIRRMYKTLAPLGAMKNNEKDEPDTEDLRSILMLANSQVERAKKITASSARIRDGLDKIRSSLEEEQSNE
jgi:hypothetical protein